MVAVKGKYDGSTVYLEKPPMIDECEVIVTFLDVSENEMSDDGSLEYLFRNYKDDGIREPIISFGKAIGNEQW